MQSPPPTPDINYEPLDSMNNAWGAVMRTALHGYAWQLAVLLTLGGIGLAFVVKDARAIIVPDALFFGYIGKLVSTYKNNVWERFASANGWGLDIETSQAAIIPPSMQFGHSPHFSPVIQAQIGTLTTDLFSYNCTVGYGRNSTTYYFTVALIKGPRPSPHIVLRSTRGGDTIRNDLVNMEKLKLEGDFNNSFTLEIEKGQEIDALAVLTPDVMQTLVSYNTNEDIEMLDDNIYFIVNGDHRDSFDVRQLVQSVLELSGQIYENARLAMPQTSGTAVLGTV